MYFRRISDLRQDHDLTQKQVAQLLGCNREVYRRYEQGYREIPLWALIHLAKLFQVSTDYIMGLSDCKRSCCSLASKPSVNRRLCCTACLSKAG